MKNKAGVFGLGKFAIFSHLLFNFCQNLWVDDVILHAILNLCDFFRTWLRMVDGLLTGAPTKLALEIDFFVKPRYILNAHQGTYYGCHLGFVLISKSS